MARNIAAESLMSSLLKTNTYTPQQNRASERMNMTVVEKARYMLSDAKLERMLWAEAVNTAVYLINRYYTSSLPDNKTPEEYWTGAKPNLKHLRLFGSEVMVHTSKQKRAKWDYKSEKMIFIGYGDGI